MSKDAKIKVTVAGLKLSEMEENQENLISIYDNVEEDDNIENHKPNWTIGIVNNGENTTKDLVISNGVSGNRILTLKSDGRIGVNTLNPESTMHIQGNIRFNGRVGNLGEKNIVPANGKWHTIMDNLRGCHIFEVVARAYGQQGQGKYATLYAIASNAYNGKKGRISCSRNKYGWQWWRRIGLRWVGTPFDYKLQIKTFSDYGRDGEIQYSIMSLGNDFMYKANKTKNPD